MDDKQPLPADSKDASGTSGDVESMLPDLPEPEVTPPAEAAASKGMTELAESDEERGEEAEEEEAPPTMELTDLSHPGSALHAAALATGARPWSRVVSRLVS